MTWLHLYFTGSTEAGFRGAFTTGYHKGNLKINQKRTPINIAKSMDNDVTNLLGMKTMPFVMRRIFLPMFKVKNIKERTQKHNKTVEMRKWKMSSLKNMSIPMKTVFLRNGKKSNLTMSQYRIKTRQKGEQDRRLVKKNSLFSKRGNHKNMKTITFVKLFSYI